MLFFIFLQIRVFIIYARQAEVCLTLQQVFFRRPLQQHQKSKGERINIFNTVEKNSKYCYKTRPKNY